MKIKSLFLTTAVLLTTFTACNKEDGTNPSPDVEGVEDGLYIKFTQGINEGSRADAGQIADGTAVTFTSGQLFFVDGSDNIVEAVDITSTAQGGTSITVGQLKSGVVFPNVKDLAAKVYILGNHQVSPVPAKFEDVLKETTTLSNQADAPSYGVAKATLFGEGDIQDATAAIKTATGADKQAVFDVYPLIARLELKQITGKNLITGYKLAGIYINNFYYKVNVDGRAGDVTAFYDYKKNVSQYAKGAGYEAAWEQILFDEPAKTAVQVAPSTDWSVQPDNDAWAYNVFANTTAIPHIVLHFTDMSVSGTMVPNSVTGTAGEAFLTVTRYLVSGVEEEVKGGNIYRIANLEFDETDLDETPEEKTPEEDEFSVYVEVTILPWSVIDVIGGF
ncbi:MAG: hypothetical protein LUG98_02690 [Tannerellaceae bacterium]|nr:hypothetical protein [Tannerellaceae bacterium]